MERTVKDEAHAKTHRGGGVSTQRGAVGAIKLIVGPDLLILEANAAAVHCLGGPGRPVVGTAFFSHFTHPETACELQILALEAGFARGFIVEARAGCGPVTHLLCHAARIKGSSRRLAVTARDVSRQWAAAGGEATHRDKFESAFQCANIGMALVDLRCNIFESNEKLAKKLGIGKRELQCMKVTDLAVPGDEQAAQEFLKAAVGGGQPDQRVEIRLQHRSGSILYAEISMGVVRDERGLPRFAVASFRDVTERHQMEAMLEQQASIDPLTKALNRARIEERAKLELMRADRAGHKLTLLLVDLDHFKMVNDSFGHAAGDEVLSGFANIARSCLRLTDLFGRWGGEEFILMLPDTGPEGAKRLAERIRAAVERCSFPGGIWITASLGIAARRKGESFESLVQRADVAMYRAKQGGRNRVVVDADDLRAEAVIHTETPTVIELNWQKSLACGQPVIDSEHRHLFKIANMILSAVATGGKGPRIAPLIQELLADVTMHFMHEEQFLEAVKYPETLYHRECHQKLLVQAVELSSRFDRKEEIAGDLVAFVINDVVAKHILLEDRKFYPWIRRTVGPAKPSGQSAAAAFSAD